MDNDNPPPSNLPKNVSHALEVAANYAQIDGCHHKMWVIDQMLQELLGPADYQVFLNWYDSDDEYPEWDQGIAP